MIVLCRHGATDANLAGAFLSTSDPPLSAAGREQCTRAAAALASYAVERVWSSPMRRCIESAEILAPSAALEIEDALREIDFGAWNDKTLEEIAATDPAGLAERKRNPTAFRPAGGESFEDVAARIAPFAAALRAYRGDAMIVAHRGTLGVLERLLRGLPLDSQDVVPLEPGEYRLITG